MTGRTICVGLPGLNVDHELKEDWTSYSDVVIAPSRKEPVTEEALRFSLWKVDRYPFGDGGEIVWHHELAGRKFLFLIIDSTTLIHVGASLNHLGEKCFAFSSLDKSNIPDIIAKI